LVVPAHDRDGVYHVGHGIAGLAEALLELGEVVRRFVLRAVPGLLRRPPATPALFATRRR
jgi:hypothetical protein